MNKNAITSQPASLIPPDDPQRHLALARPDEDRNLSHIGVVGDTSPSCCPATTRTAATA